MRVLVLAIATGGGSGYAPVAPGTAGAAVGLLLHALLARALARPALLGAEAALLVLAVVGGAWAADRAERHFGRKDDGRITIDEVAGMLLAVLALPPGAAPAVAAFLVFRVLDVVKPPPAARFEGIAGGWGVMLDDLVAGAYANLLCQLAWRAILPLWSGAGFGSGAP